MTLQQQLEYFWERGFYSVVKDTEATSLCYFIISTKDENGRFRESEYSQTVEDAKLSIGANPGEKLGYLDYMDNWKIVDTIHPSELMGKGFQVGDKVKVPRIDGSCEVIKASSGNKDAYEVKLPINYSDMPSQFFTSSELKPVLPVEEKKEDPLKGIMTLQQYHELADLADNFMSKFKSVKDGSLSSKEREACKIVNL